MGHPTDIFVPEPSPGCICAICHDVLKEASTFRECGHTFCDECVTNYLAVQTLTRRCPNCRTAVTGSNPNYALREIVESMPVRCPEYEGKSGDAGRKRKRDDGGSEDRPDRVAKATVGCEWKGQLKDLKKHENECGFKVITCHVAGCTHTCQRQTMASHHSSPAGILRHAELRHTAQIKAMESRYENKIEIMEANYETEIRQMELRYDYNTAKMQFAMKLREQEYEKKLETKLKKDMEELEKNMYVRLSERGLESRSPGAGSEAEEQVSMARYGGLTSLNSAVFQYIKNEGASDDNGVHVNDIIVDVSSSHGVFAGDIQAAITHLLNGGRICSTIDDNNYRIAKRKSLSGAVIQFIKGANAYAGSHVNDIIRGVSAQGYSTIDIPNEIERLSNNGDIYSTIDELHYSA